jgi:hypothetical protein
VSFCGARRAIIPQSDTRGDSISYPAFPNFPEWRGSCNRTRRDTQRKAGGAHHRQAAAERGFVFRGASNWTRKHLRLLRSLLSQGELVPEDLDVLGETRTRPWRFAPNWATCAASARPASS